LKGSSSSFLDSDKIDLISVPLKKKTKQFVFLNGKQRTEEYHRKTNDA